MPDTDDLPALIAELDEGDASVHFDCEGHVCCLIPLDLRHRILAALRQAQTDRAEVERLTRLEQIAFRDHCERVAAEVAKWPEWKRNALGKMPESE